MSYQRISWPAFTVLRHPNHDDALFVDPGWPAARDAGDTVLRFLRFKGEDCHRDAMCPSQETLAKLEPIGWAHWNCLVFKA